MTIGAVLVANRGEIAARIVRACRSLGIRVVAVYSEADRDAPHVAAADDAVCIGPAAAHDSYLDVSAILEAAAATGADAIHPGYGFLSENADFARACIEGGLVFIGPPPEVIERMGSKQRAREAAIEAGVPIVPGYHGDAQDDASLSRAADEVGFPLMIKASAGGGGRGMRRVRHAGELRSALALARGEAASAFGDATMLLERLVERARHVEVQVLADLHGSVVHLFDRDCSVQRSHQKLIEEAPAPGLPAGIRQQVLEQSVALARRIGYVNAGTVEFIYDLDRQACYFLEMNTRLQVEHPVTEMITGIDLVEWQLRVAAGEPLDFTQADIICSGHAIEARVAAEDPSAGFAPGTGRVVGYDEPAGAGVRVDSGISEGTEVGHHYDSMLAKVIAHARDREAARRRLSRALAGYELYGVVTNLAFLRDMLDNDSFAGARHTTDLVDTAFPRGWGAEPLSDRQVGELALGSLLAARAREHFERDPWRTLGGWRVTGPSGRDAAAWIYAGIEGAGRREISISRRGEDFVVTVDGGTAFEFRRVAWLGRRLRYERDGRLSMVAMRIKGQDAWHGLSPGVRVSMHRLEQALLGRSGEARASDNQLRASMPGRLVEVRVRRGDTVRAGQPLIVLEAMKMYQELAAPIDGAVGSVLYTAGDTVEGGAVILEIETCNQASSHE